VFASLAGFAHRPVAGNYRTQWVGKSTLLMLLLGLYHPTRGTIDYSHWRRSAKPIRSNLLISLPEPVRSVDGEENLLFLATMQLL
jgi:ABC-type multidrug transport system ATPase subunit